VRNAFGPEQEDEEGGHWHSAVRKDNILTQIQGGVQQINKGIGQGAKVVAAGLAFLPTGHITDKERRMVRTGTAPALATVCQDHGCTCMTAQVFTHAGLI
jgi:hypothetical protein